MIISEKTTMNPDKLTVIAGPCVVESLDMLEEVAETLVRVEQECDVNIIFKASYRKANRTSFSSFSSLGDDIALEYLAQIKKKYSLPILTDIHSAEEADSVAHVADILQIPAFLCRQTDILIAAAKTGKTVNIKKGQFLAPGDMYKQAQKVTAQGNPNVWLTERGTTFGYHDLVVDMRGLIIMKESGFPVIFDATHSVQQPGGGEQSGGQPKFIRALTRAAIATGIDGLFVETHPRPAQAWSDAATQLPLSEFLPFMQDNVAMWKFMKNQSLKNIS
ncbi:MAG: 3-deoxy-8-phosphooctulonate synthase [Ignavibacteria bacterium]|nr:3-deoxy-8-phosphooctulonate synthase [Ignavibacteria bacterium]